MTDIFYSRYFDALQACRGHSRDDTVERNGISGEALNDRYGPDLDNIYTFLKKLAHRVALCADGLNDGRAGYLEWHNDKGMPKRIDSETGFNTEPWIRLYPHVATDKVAYRLGVTANLNGRSVRAFTLGMLAASPRMKSVALEEVDASKLADASGNISMDTLVKWCCGAMTKLPAYTSPFEKTDDNTSLLQSATWKVMEQPLNVIYYGPPGTGKTHRVQGIIERMRKDGEREDDFYRFVTFHPSYAYEDFVEGIRPGVTENGQVDYSVKDGVFKELCNQARENPTQPYVMVIDEINRGNISSIFGELITLIEQSKREFMPGGLSVTLPYSQEKFSVPANVFIYGTMNTADRSLTLIDTALRRRFEFVEVSPDPALLDKLMVPGASKEKPINIRRMLEEMNRRLELLYDHDHTIGHAYFTELCKLREDMRFERLSRIMEKKIIPLLEEYFFDDLKKAAIVLGDNRKSDRDCRFLITGSTAEDREILDEAGRSVHATCKRNAKALNNPDAYIGIYETSGAEGQKKA